MEQECERPRLWWPSEPFRRILQWSTSWSSTDALDEGDDEDPGKSLTPFVIQRQETNSLHAVDVIQGIDPAWDEDLGMTGRRDPDALPPTNVFQWVMHYVHDLLAGLTRGNALFALKAGTLTGTSFGEKVTELLTHYPISHLVHT